MEIMRLYVPRLFDGELFQEDQIITVSDGKIIAIDQDLANFDITISGLVVPGYVDLQVNGGGGALFNSSPNIDGIKTMLAAHSRYGTTAMLPTLITDSVEIMRQAADAVAQALQEKVPGVIGIHFEGPHLSIAKKGTHCADFIRPITEAEWQIYSRKDLGQILVTIAPEMVSISEIERLVSLGVKVSIGHTDASYEASQQAIKAGATGFTHLFNAMSQLQGRQPGVVGAALLHNDTSCGIIVDGFHVDQASCRLAIQAKPSGKVFLVTDAMSTVGTDQTSFKFFDRTVTVDNGKLTSTTGELAGSSLTMANAVKNTHQSLGISLCEALRMASLYPLRYLKSKSSNFRGMIKVGFQADFAVLDDNLSVTQTWIAAKKVF